MPIPTGPYAIGTELLEFTDQARDEYATEAPDDKRRIAVQLWYPAEPCSGADVAPYLSMPEGDFLSGPFGGGYGLAVGWQNDVLLHARSAAKLASGDERFAVLLFSHGLGSMRPTYASLIEELVSHGYIVAALSHTYDTALVTFPDGTVALLNPALTWGGFPPPTATWQEQLAADRKLDQHIKVWADDASFVLDQLTAINADDPDGVLTGRMNLEQVGMYGHSYGGATAAEAVFADPRFKAGVNLDGSFFSPERENGGRMLPAPFMIQLSSGHGFDGSVSGTFAKLAVGYEVTLADAGHGSFWDMGMIVDQLVGPGVQPDFLGRIDHVRAIEISNAYTLAFFDKHLRGKDVALLDGPSPDFPDVTFTRRP
jgi:pimeloyl-ACP methyl ester carboxylesterase